MLKEELLIVLALLITAVMIFLVFVTGILIYYMRKNEIIHGIEDDMKVVDIPETATKTAKGMMHQKAPFKLSHADSANTPQNPQVMPVPPAQQRQAQQRQSTSAEPFPPPPTAQAQNAGQYPVPPAADGMQQPSQETEIREHSADPNQGHKLRNKDALVAKPDGMEEVMQSDEPIVAEANNTEWNADIPEDGVHIPDEGGKLKYGVRYREGSSGRFMRDKRYERNATD